MELICEFIRLILQSIKLIYQSTSLCFLLFYTFLRSCIHDRIGLCVCRVLVDKRDNHVVKQDKPASRL